MFHELLSRDHEDGRARPPCEQGEAGGPPGNRPAIPRDWFPYLNGTSQGEPVLSEAEGTPEDARKDGHIRGRRK